MPNPDRLARTLALVTLVAATGGFLFGYDTAVINGANQYLKAHFRLDALQEGLAGASAILGCIPGAMLAGFLSDRFGRRKVLFLCALLYAASGINAIMYYSTKIFTTAGVGVQSAFTSSVIVGLVNFLFTFVAIALVDKAGRRALLLVGLTVQVLALGAVGWMFHAGTRGLPLLLAILAFIGAFAMALGPIPWILCSEIFPTKVRGRAMSVATFTIWTACYLVAQTFPLLNDHPAIGPAVTFWVYGACSLAALVFTLALVPETKGRTLEEIERTWR